MVFKKKIKKGLANLFTACGGYTICRWLNRNRLIVIYYHRVVGKLEAIDDNISGMFVREDEFENQLRLLKKEYNLISNEQLFDHISRGSELPQYPLMITFDDGYKDNYKLAYPLLKKYNIPWTLFVTTGYVNRELLPWFDIIFILWQKLPEISIDGKKLKTTKQSSVSKLQFNSIFNKLSEFSSDERNIFIKKLLTENIINTRMWEHLFCTWDNLAAMKNDVAIGAHTHTHQILSKLSESQLKKEILPARKELEERLCQKVTSFAYPNGRRQDFNEKSVAILKANNFNHAFSTHYGLNEFHSRKNDHSFYLNRIGIDYFDTIKVFKMKITGAWRWFAG